MKRIITSLALFIFVAAAQAQVSNLDFETWDTSTVTLKEYPANWPNLTDGYCKKSTHAYQGNYALTTSVWYYYVKTSAIQHQAINYNPVSLDGYYTYTDNRLLPVISADTVADTALVSVYLTKWDAVNLVQDTVGQGTLPLFAAANYTHFICPVNYTSTAIADSVTIILDPSIIRRRINATTHNTINGDGYGSFFTTDALSLNPYPAGVAEIVENVTVNVYPNPTASSINIVLSQSGSYTARIVDVKGSVIKTSPITGSSAMLNVQDLSAGAYFVTIINKDGHAIATNQFVRK